MKLSKYLADYLADGISRLHEAGLPMDFTKEGLEPAIQEGIEVFELTEGWVVLVVSKATAERIKELSE